MFTPRAAASANVAAALPDSGRREGGGWGRRPSPDNFRTTATYIYIFLFWGDLFLFLFPLARLAYRSPETRVCRGRVQNGSPCPEKRMIDIPEIQAVHVPSRGRPRGSWHRAAAPPPPPLGAETRTGNPGKFRQHDRGGAGHAVRNLSGARLRKGGKADKKTNRGAHVFQKANATPGRSFSRPLRARGVRRPRDVAAGVACGGGVVTWPPLSAGARAPGSAPSSWSGSRSPDSPEPEPESGLARAQAARPRGSATAPAAAGT